MPFKLDVSFCDFFQFKISQILKEKTVDYKMSKLGHLN